MHRTSQVNINIMDGSKISWEGVAILGGPREIMRRAIDGDGISAQPYRGVQPALAQKPLEGVEVSYDLGRIDAANTVWENVSTTADHARISMDGTVFASCWFGGEMSVVAGTFTIVWNAQGLVGWKDIMDYHDALESIGVVKRRDEAARESLVGIYQGLSRIRVGGS